MVRDRTTTGHERAAVVRILLMTEDKVVEIESRPDEADAHRRRRHMVMEAVSIHLACSAAEGVDSCCATLQRSRLPTYDERDLVVGGRMSSVSHALDRLHSHLPW